MDINEFIKAFLEDRDRRAIYNEFSLQHELGTYLQNNLQNKGYKVEFERNVDFFNIDKRSTVKKEIDIVMYKGLENTDEKIAIELKYHHPKCNVPQRMFDGIVDIKFMEELKKKGFRTYVCVVSERKEFYSGDKAKLNVYKYYRTEEKIHGKIRNEICYKDKKRGTSEVTIDGNYEICWNDLNPSSNEKPYLKRKYYVLQMNNE